MMVNSLSRAAWMIGAGLVLQTSCGGTLTSAQMAERSRVAMPACEKGDAEQCVEACSHGGPNRACAAACKAGNGDGCYRLAARLEREIDVDDAEAQPRPIAAPEAEEITATYERACQLGLGKGCMFASVRVLGGQGPGRRRANDALDMMRRGCKTLGDAETCCAMARYNLKLSAVDEGGRERLKEEAESWARAAENRGGKCDLTTTR